MNYSVHYNVTPLGFSDDDWGSYPYRDDRMDVMEITWDNGNTTTAIWAFYTTVWWHCAGEGLQVRDQLSKFDPSR